MAAKLKTLERENRKLRQANEIRARLALILPRRSSTADKGHDRVRRGSPRGIWVSRSARCCRSPHPLSRPCRKAGRSRQDIGAREAGCDPQDRDQACLREELRRLRRAKGLAAIAPRGRGYRTMHRGATEAQDGPARRDPRQAGQNHDRDCRKSCARDRVSIRF